MNPDGHDATTVPGFPMCFGSSARLMLRISSTALAAKALLGIIIPDVAAAEYGGRNPTGARDDA